MTEPLEPLLVRELRGVLRELERENAALRRQVTELREAVNALLQPSSFNEYLETPPKRSQ